MTDEVKIGADNGGQRFNFYNFNLNNQTGEASAHWTGNYFVINAVNRVLDGAAGVEVDPADQASYDNILGQLYGLRAFAHFNLLKWFATDYTDGSSLAVPYVDFMSLQLRNFPEIPFLRLLPGLTRISPWQRALLEPTTMNW